MTEKIPEIGCIIMASGLSERYGRNKLLEKLDGREIILHAAACLMAAGLSPLAVTRSAEVKALLEKATAELDGADYTPVAYLGTQVVAGTNHLLICKVTPVVPDAVSTYALVTIYEDLKGEANITEVQNNDAEAGVLDAPGGWQDTESLEVTKESLEALRLASQKLTGATYSPVALLGTQVVAGTNYRMLCTVTPVTPNAEPKYEIVVISVDVDMETGTLETYGFYTTEEEAGE